MQTVGGRRPVCSSVHVSTRLYHLQGFRTVQDELVDLHINFLSIWLVDRHKDPYSNPVFSHDRLLFIFTACLVSVSTVG